MSDSKQNGSPNILDRLGTVLTREEHDGSAMRNLTESSVRAIEYNNGIDVLETFTFNDRYQLGVYADGRVHFISDEGVIPKHAIGGAIAQETHRLVQEIKRLPKGGQMDQALTDRVRNNVEAAANSVISDHHGDGSFLRFQSTERAEEYMNGSVSFDSERNQHIVRRVTVDAAGNVSTARDGHHAPITGHLADEARAAATAIRALPERGRLTSDLEGVIRNIVHEAAEQVRRR